MLIPHLLFCFLVSEANAVDRWVTADSPVSTMVTSGGDVTFSWHSNNDKWPQTKAVLHTSAGTILLESPTTRYTWKNFPEGYGWWWVESYQTRRFWNFKRNGKTSVKIFHNINPASWSLLSYQTTFENDGTVKFFELQQDYTLDLKSYFEPQDQTKLPDCCEGDVAAMYSWASSLPPCDWDFIRLEPGGILTIKQGYRWDGASYPCKALGNPCVDDMFNIRSSLVHDALYDLMRMKYLLGDDLIAGSAGHTNRKMADMLLYMIGIEDGQWKAGFFHSHNPLTGFGLKGRGAEPDWDLMRASGWVATNGERRLYGWKYHVSGLTATPDNGRVVLQWQRANESGRQPASHQALDLPHPGYEIIRDGIMRGRIAGSSIDLNAIVTSYQDTDSTLAYGNTYTYQVRRISVVNQNFDDYSNATRVTLVLGNTPPEVFSGSDAAIYAGDTFSRSGFFTDMDSGSWTATVDYGDGIGEQPLVLTGQTFTLNCLYATSGIYTVTVTVTDDQGDSGTDTVFVKVTGRNIAPEIYSGPDETIPARIPFIRQGSFMDMDSTEWTATVNYGDGSGDQPLTLTENSFTLNHLYTAKGCYTIVITVRDNDGGIGRNILEVTATEKDFSLLQFIPQLLNAYNAADKNKTRY